MHPGVHVNGWQIMMSLGKRMDLPSGLLGDVYLTAAVSGLIGARLLYVLINHDEFDSITQWFDLRGGGLVAYGGFLGAAVHLRIKQVSLLTVGDAAAPAIALGLFFTRIGCYLYGSDFGTRLPESAPGALTALVLAVFYRRQLAGQALLVLAMAYGTARFVLEYLRDDPERGSLFGFSTSQLISLWLVPVALVAHSLLRKRARGAPAPI